MVTEKIKETIIRHGLIEKGEHMVLGLSGGPDSICLFHVLYGLRDFFQIEITAVHVNHQFRPGAAEEDQEYVEHLCKNMGIPCHSFVVDVNAMAKAEKLSGEDAGRKVRYQSFYQVAAAIKEREGKDVKIAVAQNMNDQGETLLMRIMRGTGTDGLAGIEYKRISEEGWPIIRPLLDVTREEIEAYCREYDLNPREDHTNKEAIYTRNKVRLELLPYMEKHFNGNIIAALHRLSTIAKEDKDYLYQVAEDIIHQHGKIDLSEDRATMDVAVLMDQHPAIGNRIIIGLFEKLGLANNISAHHLGQARKILAENKTSSYTDFSSGYGMKIAYGQAVFYKKREVVQATGQWTIPLADIMKNHELKGGIRAKLLDKTQWIAEEGKNPKNQCALSWDRIQEKGLDLTLRFRRQGDYIVPSGMKGRKKLQDYFVDGKIPKEERGLLPLICIGSEVLWVMGKRTNENYRITEETERILLLEYSYKM